MVLVAAILNGTRVLVSILCGVVLGRDNQTPALSGSAIDSFDDVDRFLLVLHGPVDLIVVTGTLK
jgi:hypothetical protein